MLERVTLVNNEYPPFSIGGAGMIVGELSKFLSKSIKTEIRCFGSYENNKNSSLIIDGYDKREKADFLELLESTIKMAKRKLN